ncbi:hypothetical protein P3T76_007020 [Phytophthora citrophthora]|uniref:Crinkler effector protein N-terminal domain-containing protein n=1 Tax=Phytophthora citrophthora TaxID=4793 RepID=A0AAD9LNH1_9STRA|nr:hypothetical protein P3T76_007020 [Phytophthora citrophthora]
MVARVCVIVGVGGSAFPVDIDASLLVGHVKEAIKEKNPATIACDTKDLQLFLAKKDGAWLPSNDLDMKKLRSGAIPKQVEELLHEEIDPTEEIDDLFGGAPTKKTIHVLVVIPEGAVGTVSEASRIDQLVEKVDKMYEHTVLGKRKVYCHSSASSTLLTELNVRMQAIRAVRFATEDLAHGEPFTWESISDERGQDIALTEEQQRDRYHAYVEVNIGDVLTRNRLCVYGVEKGKTSSRPKSLVTTLNLFGARI